jgi:hypothetical protein
MYISDAGKKSNFASESWGVRFSFEIHVMN